MLIQITNNCRENCEHCFQNSKNESCGLQHMSHQIFIKSVEVAKNKFGAQVLVVSGGEPTLNQEWYDFIKYLNFTAKVPFTLITNGTWVTNEDIYSKIKRTLSFQFCLGVQVTSVKKYYKSFELIKANEDKFKALGNKLFLDLDVPLFMEDIGRARFSSEAQKDVDINPYHMSCLNACLAFKQVKNLKQVGNVLVQNRQFCKPAIDWQGNIHLSESWLCPSIGSVWDSPIELFNKGREFKPCLACRNAKKFMASDRPDIIAARHIIFND